MTIQPASEVPAEDLAIAVAHSADTVLNNLGHASRHALAVQNAATPESRVYNLKHLVGHVQRAGRHQRKNIEILARYRPDFAAELARLDEATQLTPPARSAGGAVSVPAPADDVPPASRPATVMHLAGTVAVALGHAELHAVEAQQAAGSASRAFHMRHCSRHIGEALEHQRKAVAALVAYFPEVGHEITSLAAVTSPASPASRTPVVDTDRSAGLALAGQRCDGCGELTEGGPCIECGRSNGDAYRQAVESARAGLRRDVLYAD